MAEFANIIKIWWIVRCGAGVTVNVANVVYALTMAQPFFRQFLELFPLNFYKFSSHNLPTFRLVKECKMWNYNCMPRSSKYILKWHPFNFVCMVQLYNLSWKPYVYVFKHHICWIKKIGQNYFVNKVHPKIRSTRTAPCLRHPRYEWFTFKMLRAKLKIGSSNFLNLFK